MTMNSARGVRALRSAAFAVACVAMGWVMGTASAQDSSTNGELEPILEYADPYGEDPEHMGLEEVAPPSLTYSDYAGPDPVLEGEPGPPRLPQTAGERTVAELRETGDLAGTPVEAGPPEFGLRAILEVMMALCIVLGLIVLALLFVRRVTSRAPMLGGLGLGRVIGRVYLSPKASLHFVRAGGKVLVVGVTQENVQHIATFEESLFDGLNDTPEGTQAAAPLTPDQPSPRTERTPFLAQLREQTARLRQPAAPAASARASDPPQGDGEIQDLRGDIERLQRLLREATRE